METARDVRSIWWNGRRVYQYYSRRELDENTLAGKYPMHPVSSYWESRGYYDRPTHRLYVRLSDRANPDSLGMQVPRFPYGVHLRDCHYVVLDGFTIRHFGVGHEERGSIGVNLDKSSNCVIRNCTIYGVNDGIRFYDWPHAGQEELYANNTIEANHVYQVGPAGVDWNLYKWSGQDSENAAIKPKQGRGVVIRNNTLHGFFNGIQPSTLGDGSDDLLSYPWLGGADMDINNNLLYDIKDDGTECDGACCNTRIWNNVFYGVWHGVSNCPNGVGPSFVVRNLYHHRYGSVVPAYSFLKFSSGGARVDGRTYVYHNTVYNPHGAALEESNDSRFFTLRNNLLVSGARYTVQLAEPIAGFDFDYDLLYHRSGDALAKIWTPQGLVRFDGLAELRQGMGWEEHGVEANPRFARGDDPQATRDFRLSSSSPARGKALPLGNFSNGWRGGKAAPDIGAFCYGREELIGPARRQGDREGAP